jgi:hypothetical protein
MEENEDPEMGGEIGIENISYLLGIFNSGGRDWYFIQPKEGKMGYKLLW